MPENEAGPDAGNGKSGFGLLRHWNHPLLWLLLFLLYLAVTILADVEETNPRKKSGSYDFSQYAEVLPTGRVSLHTLSSPFLALDLVRACLAPISHPEKKRTFIAATFVFLVLLLAATYLSATLADDQGAGLIAALFLGTVPFMMAAARVYDIHVPRLAAIQLVLAFIFLFHRHPSGKTMVAAVLSILAGIFICSFFSNYMFFCLHVAAPIAWVVGRGMIAQKNRLFYLLAGILFTAALIFPLLPLPVLNLPAHLNSLGDIGDYFRRQQAQIYLPSVWDDPRGFLAYFYVLFHLTLFLPLSLVSATGFVAFLWRKDVNRGYWLVAMLFPMVVLIFAFKRNIYYVANLLPALSVSAALGLNSLLRRAPRAGRVALWVALVLLNGAYADHLIQLGRISPGWEKYFVDGRRQYQLKYDEVGLEPFGTLAGQEDLKASIISDRIFWAVPRPMSVAFIGNLCWHERLVVELQWRGIYSRDLLCGPAEENGRLNYDAIVVLPYFWKQPGFFAAGSLVEFYQLLLEAVEKNAHLYYLHSNLTPLVPILRQDRYLVEVLSARYSRKIVKEDHLIFIAPENEELAKLLERKNPKPLVGFPQYQ